MRKLTKRHCKICGKLCQGKEYCRECGKCNDKVIYWRYYGLKTRAKRTGIEFGFTRKEFETWFNHQELKCHYCGADLIKEATRDTQSPFDLTVDRKDNKCGYVSDNIVMACKRCNLIKTDIFTEQEMVEIATKYDLKSRD